MPEYIYRARDLSGKTVSETITAANLEEAASILKAQKYQIITLNPKAEKQALIKVKGSVSVVEKANLCHYLSTMINAGLPLIESVASIARDTKNPTLKSILINAQTSLQQGDSLSATFARYPNIFDKVFITIVKAGERSGTLHKSFKYLKEQMLTSHTLAQKVKSALVYPAVIISTMIGVGVILIVFVVPQIAQVFLKTKLEVPKITTIILQTGLFLKNNLLYLGLGLLVLIIFTIIALKSAKGKKVIMGFVKKIPGITLLFEKLDLARFSRTLATLMQSGVPITESLAVSTIALSQEKFTPLKNALTSDIKKGESIAAIFRKHPKHLPQMMLSMVATGEKTGTLDKILLDIALFYEQELEAAVKNFTAILEPIIMLIIGIGVGGMVLSVIAPVYSLVSSLQGLQ